MNGSWSQWSSWQPCSVTCGDGNRVRARTCSNPAPKWNGKDCPGANISTESCFMLKCKGICRYLNFFIFLKAYLTNIFDFRDRFYLTTWSKNRKRNWDGFFFTSLQPSENGKHMFRLGEKPRFAGNWDHSSCVVKTLFSWQFVSLFFKLTKFELRESD